MFQISSKQTYYSTGNRWLVLNLRPKELFFRLEILPIRKSNLSKLTYDFY